ncbi:MAG: hypothetical protein K2J80_13305 [Oscillospiraceae bacterium]|nr:hypothetical protein [Oscillospiraceae bacterium]
MDIGIIAVGIMAVLGIIMFFAPRMCASADKRDDPDALAQIKKLGIMMFAGAIGAALLMLKYSSR